MDPNSASGGPAGSTGPIGSGDYVVQPGDDIYSISDRSGVPWKKIWDDPANADLKARRKSPNILLPGDQITIPPVEQREENRSTDQTHVFQLTDDQVYLKLRLLELDQPLANEAYTLNLDVGPALGGTTDGDGRISEVIPAQAQQALLTVGESPNQLRYQLRIGYLDPVTEPTGVQQRLKNLGYPPGPIDGIWGRLSKAALKEFQTDNNLEPTGNPDDDTQAKLQEQHGS